MDGSITASCFVVIASCGVNAAKTWEFQGLGETHPFDLLYLLLSVNYRVHDSPSMWRIALPLLATGPATSHDAKLAFGHLPAQV